jgi:hypothetical protein
MLDFYSQSLAANLWVDINISNHSRNMDLCTLSTPLFIRCPVEQIYIEASDLVSVICDFTIVNRGTGSFNSQKIQ